MTISFPPAAALTYLVLWMQPASSNGTGNAMLPVAKIDQSGVWYTHNFDDRLVFRSMDEADKTIRRIYDEYGLGQHVQVVSDVPSFAAQRARDRFLPAWAWLDQYGGH